MPRSVVFCCVNPLLAVSMCVFLGHLAAPNCHHCFTLAQQFNSHSSSLHKKIMFVNSRLYIRWCRECDNKCRVQHMQIYLCIYLCICCLCIYLCICYLCIYLCMCCLCICLCIYLCMCCLCICLCIMFVNLHKNQMFYNYLRYFDSYNKIYSLLLIMISSLCSGFVL